MLPLGAIFVGSHLLIAVAGQIPDIDLKTTCRAAASVTGVTTQKDIDACVADEQDAHAQLVKEWSQFSATAKARCVHASTDYLPSYVEVLTCLELTRDAKELPEEKAPPPGRRHR